PSAAQRIFGARAFLKPPTGPQIVGLTDGLKEPQPAATTGWRSPSPPRTIAFGGRRSMGKPLTCENGFALWHLKTTHPTTRPGAASRRRVEGGVCHPSASST